MSDLFTLLQKSKHPLVKKLIAHFGQYAPYRFLSPWLKGPKSEVVKQSQFFVDDCLYSLNKANKSCIQINPDWTAYLISNNKVLLDFSYWNLLQFAQAKNPNVPNIASKLIEPITKTSLNRQRNFWNLVLKENDSLKCIYTGKPLRVGSFKIIHFVPWGFVSHNQMWNLIPVDKSVSSSKDNKLPVLDKHFDAFVDIQYEAINRVYKQNPKMKLLDDYFILGSTIGDVIKKPRADFKQIYYKTISPLIEIASNSGFEF